MKLKKFTNQPAIPRDKDKKIKPPLFQPVAQKIVDDLIVEFVNKKKNYNPIQCPYNGQPRMIHPAACEWHKECQDKECYRIKCPRIMQ